MTIWTNQKGTQSAVISTEHTLAQNSGANGFQFSVDTSNMVNGDVLELRVYRIINATPIQLAVGTFSNVQASVLKEYKITASQGITNGIKVTLKQTAGTGRNYDWELLADNGGVVVTTNNDKTGYSITQAFPTNFSSLSIDGSGRIDLGKILGTASAGLAGSVSIDWAQVKNPTTALSLSGTTISTAQTVTSTGSVTSGVTVTTNNDKTGYTLSSAGNTSTATTIFTTAMTEAYPVKGSTFTLAQAMYNLVQRLNEMNIASTTLTVTKRDQATAAKTFTLNSATAPTAVTEAT